MWVAVMSDADTLRGMFLGLEVNEVRTEATLQLRDGSRLHFRHRVDQRQAEATGDDVSAAGQVLARIAMFRLNRRHLDIHFADGTRWETLFSDLPHGPGAVS
jgi:hypothetical protein